MVTQIWGHFHDNNPPKKYLTLEETEVAKVALNAFIVNKITFANFLGECCEGMDNVDVHRITDTIGIDKEFLHTSLGMELHLAEHASLEILLPLSSLLVTEESKQSILSLQMK